MPGYADTLSEEDRWNLAMFVASLVNERRWHSYLFDAPNWDEPLFR
jgi:mono/diheme cytochrome c family protein